MSVADRDRLVFEEYADLGRHLAGVWRRERVRCVVCRGGWFLLTGFARAGLAMVGISPYEVTDEAAARRVAARPGTLDGASGAGSGPASGTGSADSAVGSETGPDVASDTRDGDR